MRRSAVAALLLLLCSSTDATAEDATDSIRGASKNTPIQQQLLANQNNNNNGLLDGRWKSTKLTIEQKKALGIVPPPGYDYPEDPVESIVGNANHSDATKKKNYDEGRGGDIKDESYYFPDENKGEDAPAEEGGGDTEDEGVIVKDESYYFGKQDDDEDGALSVVNTAQEEKGDEKGSNKEDEGVIVKDESYYFGKQDDDEDGDLSVVDTVQEEQEQEQVMEEQEADSDPSHAPKPNRRKFISYTPSTWEEHWVDGIDNLVKYKSICDTLLHVKDQITRTHDFMDMICMARLNGDYEGWCYYHDHNHYLWYNSNNRGRFEVHVDTTPLVLEGTDPPATKPLFIDSDKNWEGIASKFTFQDETTGEQYVEYIEPLVGQLRFPLTECLENQPLLADFTSYVIPPPNFDRVDGRTILYDIGSKDWSRMEYIVEEWEAHGVDFAYLITYATDGNEVTDEFLKTVPKKHAGHIVRHYVELVDHPTTENESELFLPTEIQKETRDDDYVMLKLDRTNADLKESIVQYILDNDIMIDELVWEINAGNYVMEPWFDAHLQFDELSSMTLGDAYRTLQQLRNKGIRAHSWI